MALRPNLRPHLIVGELSHPHTLEFFWDYICPYSGKSSNAVETVKIILRPHPQPWHASSTLVHEAALAVAKVAPASFWAYSLALFKAQESVYDIPTQSVPPAVTREKLAQLGKESGTLTDSEVQAVKDLLQLKSTPNGGNGVTDDLKSRIKYSRQNSIHVSPTVLFDGLVANDVSSSWGKDEWEKFPEKNVTA
ncbi:hypothetical protein M408DRAFT_25771 [Serendipita vermifera MAFF 305830]|uniref:Thioredoxin-like fold domain-containing protein n=1 Tax=Serendipita vermifera MAFF 305830 TaxID=933852 RepID=A0A0C3B0Y2_SERVB|nr:hypothetical protein M408DRAFT_25771 [Serendipita vermifera MAFF 305830]